MDPMIGENRAGMAGMGQQSNPTPKEKEPGNCCSMFYLTHNSHDSTCPVHGLGKIASGACCKVGAVSAGRAHDPSCPRVVRGLSEPESSDEIRKRIAELHELLRMTKQAEEKKANREDMEAVLDYANSVSAKQYVAPKDRIRDVFGNAPGEPGPLSRWTWDVTRYLCRRYEELEAGQEALRTLVGQLRKSLQVHIDNSSKGAAIFEERLGAIEKWRGQVSARLDLVEKLMERITQAIEEVSRSSRGNFNAVAEILESGNRPRKEL